MSSNLFEGLKILYLEDEPLVAFDTSEHLESLGFAAVDVAYRLGQAESFCAENSYDLALLDINVGKGETSLQLGDTLSERGTRIVFASGNSTMAPALTEKGFGFLDKPFSLSKLTQALENIAPAISDQPTA